MRTDPLVLDAQPLLVFFHRQPGWEFVEQVLNEAFERGESHLISSINFGEIYYSLLREYDVHQANEAIARIRQGPIDIVIPSLDQTILAATFKAGGGISYADCYAGALAQHTGLPVLTGDPEFKRLEAFGVQVEWLH